MRTRNDPWNAWNLWTALIAVLFFALWLLVSSLGLFDRGNAAVLEPAVAPTINRLASNEIVTNPLALSGTGVPNSSLQLRIGNKTIGPIVVGADGRWTTQADIADLSGQFNAVVEMLVTNGQVGAHSNLLELNLKIPSTSVIAFYYPRNYEKLNAQDYVLSGKGIPGDQLEIWQTTPDGTNKLDTTTVGADGFWNSYVPSKNPGTFPGTYTYALRRPGYPEVIAERTVIVKKGLVKASNSRCPCRLRIFTNREQNIADSTITLFNNGNPVETGTRDKQFTDLGAGDYTFWVTAPNYESFTRGKVLLPKNKNIVVYLEPKR